MGAAAYNRGSALIRRQIAQGADEARRKEDRRRALEIALNLDAWRRDALAMLADPEGEGVRGFLLMFIQGATEKRGRVYEARERKVTEAHGRWIDADERDPFAYLGAARDYAQAVYRLLDWASGQYKNPCLMTAPKQARA